MDKIWIDDNIRERLEKTLRIIINYNRIADKLVSDNTLAIVESHIDLVRSWDY